MKSIIFSGLLTFVLTGAMAQSPNPGKKEEKLIQFSGVVLAADSLYPVSFASLYDVSAGNATHADASGFFSFVARKGDTVMFAAVGYKRSVYIIPDTLSQNRYSILQLMKPDTIILKEVPVYPWPSKEDFAQVFLNLELPASDIDKMNRNMTLAELKNEKYDFGTDAMGSYKNAMAMQYTKVYGAGQIPTINLLSPTAWSKFIQSWKKGDFKKKQ